MAPDCVGEAVQQMAHALKPGDVLMLGFMNEEAFQKTVETGFATFFSRSRNKLWLKGESSGHRLVVKEISADCDELFSSVVLIVEGGVATIGAGCA